MKTPRVWGKGDSFPVMGASSASQILVESYKLKRLCIKLLRLIKCGGNLVRRAERIIYLGLRVL